MAYGLVALWPYKHAYAMYIYGKCRPLNLCQNMQKKVKMDCIHNMPILIKSVLVSTVRRLLERLGKTTRRMLVLKVSVSTLNVAPAVAGC